MNEAFEKANQKMHPIETQWHFETMTKHGYVSDTPPQQGFVRNYLYKHPGTGREIRVYTGCSADYWHDQTSGERGFWTDLAPHVQAKA